MPSDVTGHLTEADVEALGAELDRIREEVLANRGESDARYIRRVIAVQRGLEAGGRAMLLVSLLPPAWVTGTALLSVAKILENMEIGHNVLHGQWDWMRDPKIHSTTWEFDLVTPAAAWKRTHNEIHHTWTNVVGKDRDLGYTILRVSEDQPWHPLYLAQPLYNALLAPVFEWGIALYDLEFDAVVRGEKSTGEFLREVRGLLTKATRQVTCPAPRPCRACSAASPPTSPATSGPTRSSSAGTSPRPRRPSPKRRSRTRPAAPGTCANSSARPTSREAGSSTS